MVLLGAGLPWGSVLAEEADGRAADAGSLERAPIDLRAFRPVEGPSSGPEVYYEVLEEDGRLLLRGDYRVGLESVALGAEVPEELRRRALLVRWRWRVRSFPAGGDECRPGKGDSAASFNLAFKRGLKWYVIKYVWTTDGPLGATCDRRRSLTLNRDTVVLARGGEVDTWRTEIINVRRAFREHFARGDGEAETPDLVGVGLASDGDQTRSAAGADWAGLEIMYR